MKTKINIYRDMATAQHMLEDMLPTLAKEMSVYGKDAVAVIILKKNEIEHICSGGKVETCCPKLIYNDSTESFWFGEKEIKLARKELQIFMLLSSSPGHCYSKETIYETCWQTRYCYEDAQTINVYIRKLRQAIAHAGLTDKLKLVTHYGKGVALCIQ